MLSFNISLLIQLLIFLVVMICVNFLLFRPLDRLHERRRQAFQRLEDDVAALEREKTRKVAAYQQRLDEEHRQILSYRGSLNEALEREKVSILAQARKQAGEIVGQETSELQADLAAVRQALEAQTRRFAEEVFAKVVGRPLGAKH
jgi:F-type H+-transporting ATPase subunit b